MTFFPNPAGSFPPASGWPKSTALLCFVDDWCLRLDRTGGVLAVGGGVSRFDRAALDTWRSRLAREGTTDAVDLDRTGWALAVGARGAGFSSGKMRLLPSERLRLTKCQNIIVLQ
jgi:hypothetical protein